MRLFRIALLGNPGNGKTQIGNALIDLAGGVRLSFAREVKREAAKVLLALDDVQIDEDNVEALIGKMEDPATKDGFRPLLQVWGTEFRRASDENYWINKVAAHVMPGSGNQVIDDARFQNEYDLLKGRGFYFVRLEDGETTRPLTGAQRAHESEAYWRDFPVDLTLPYVKGPEGQARRILAALLTQA